MGTMPAGIRKYGVSMKKLLACSLALLLGLPVAAAAQVPPQIQEFYFDEDANVARPLEVIAGDDEATQQRLLRMIERNDRRAQTAAGQLARIAFQGNRVETGKALYELAMDGLGKRSALYHSLVWNYAWDLFRNGEVEEALLRWAQVLPERPGNPAWAPPTLALALWRLDRREEAVAWYGAAVRTWPDRWRSPNLVALLPDWTDSERETLRQIHAAWQENPPAWP